MSKIIKVTTDVVTISLDTGQVIEVERDVVGFAPNVNDIVEVFDSGGAYIVNKVVPTAVNPHTTTTTIIANGTVVNKVTYVLLAFFLGGAGAHKFYAGKIGMGLVYLLFCWTLIPAFIAFIEGIIALTKPEIQPGMIVV